MSKGGYRLLAGIASINRSSLGAAASTLPIKPIPPASFVYFVMFCDVVTSLVIACGIPSIVVISINAISLSNFSAIFLCTLLLITHFRNSQLYKIEKIENFQKSSASIAAVWMFTAFVVGLFVFLALPRWPEEMPVYAGFFVAVLLALIGERFLMSRLFQYCVKRGVVAHTVVAIGCTALAYKFSSHIKANRFGVRVGAIFDDAWVENHTQSDATLSPGIGLNAFAQYYKANHIDTIVITLPMDDSERLRYLVKQLSIHPVNIRMLPGELALGAELCRHEPAGDIPGIQLMTVANRPIDNWGCLAKFMMDRIIAIVGLIFFGPIMLGCALGIKLSSPGPILFRQKRIGYRNELFAVYKFRSMHLNCCDTGKLTERGDARIFKFGQIMRKFSLDELPQIFNVLKGDMSLVGPRPHMPEARAAGYYYYDIVADYASRHRVKPGITGWAQINGWRGPTETIEQIKNRVAHDLYYIDNWSIGFDILILVKTAFVGFFGENAF